MGQIKPVEPVKLFCGMIAADEAVFARAQAELEKFYGRIDHESGLIPFTFTDYYREEMGEKLWRKFVSFEALIDPRRIAEIKNETNAIEEQMAETEGGAVRRRVNLDPGYLTLAKLVLATTKDFSHRLYVGKGIYTEVTLNFRKDGCTYHPWTYPDYRSEQYARFFLAVRRILRGQLGASARPAP